MASLINLIVRGVATFLNPINGDITGNSATVNNHTVLKDVPADAKFTDTVTTASTTGSGNAVTAITASNGALTVTKGTTFLTSHQDISGKADKSATVSTVAWDSTNKKLTKTINGTTTDVVTAATLRTGLNVADGAEVNQNAFSNVTVGSTTIAADDKTDTLTLVAGSNVTLTPDATNDKITIAATNSTYTAASAAPLMDGTAAVGTSTKYAREDHVHPTDTSRAASDHTHTTSMATSTGTSSISLGYGAKYQLTAGGTSYIFTTPSLGTTATTAAAGNHTHSTYAPLASPGLTGTPTAPTAAAGTNTTQIATTAFVTTAVGGYVKKTGDTMSGDLTIDNTNPVLYLDAGLTGQRVNSSKFIGIGHNGTNLWIGAGGTDSSHIGKTIISTGMYPDSSTAATNGEPYETIYVAVPEGFSVPSGTYGVWHEGNLDPDDYATISGWDASKVMISNANGNLIASALPYSYISGLTSSAQTQINSKVTEANVIVDSANLSSTTLATATAKTIGSSVKIPAGHWIVTVCVRYNSNATGYRQAWIASSSNGDAIAQAAKTSIQAANGDQTFCHLSYPLHITSETAYYIVGKQSSGGNLAALGYVRWFGIKD